ncbi:MAG TPA: BamA/TamA family outer membrane protein [Gemmatimonadales bacterium]|nr:BamA/TamA family outer membrane protein [Gemmatimonadales bacterium]
MPLAPRRWVLCFLAGFPSPGLAQRYWDQAYAPLAYYSTVDGLWLAGYARVYSPVIGWEARPEPYLAWAQLGAGASTEGSYTVELEAQAPAWWQGWRAALTLAAERRNRLGYYGLGNATLYRADSAGSARPYFYRVSRTVFAVRATVQRRIAGPLRALAGAGVSRTDYRGLPGETAFERDLARGTLDPDQIPFTDGVVRAGLVVDTRDHESDPHAGVLLEALYAAGRGYERVTGAARLYAHPVERWILAARVAGERLSGDPPLAAQSVLESSGDPVAAVGGYRSLRGYPEGRFTGSGKLLAGVEARYALLLVSPYELKLFGFYDAGRVFGPGERFRLTVDDLHAGAGAGAAARLGRNTVFVLGAGFTGEGWELLFEGGWSY